jgi:hypothetical protein
MSTSESRLWSSFFGESLTQTAPESSEFAQKQQFHSLASTVPATNLPNVDSGELQIHPER